MIKVIGLLKRRADLTHEEFSDYWFNKHQPLGERIVPKSALSVGYVQNHAVSLGKGGEALFDAVAELVFEDRAGLQRWIEWYNSDAGKELRDDELNFMDVSQRVLIVTDERVIRDSRHR